MRSLLFFRENMAKEFTFNADLTGGKRKIDISFPNKTLNINTKHLFLFDPASK